MVWDTADPDFTAIKDAFLNDTTLDMAVMDGDINNAGHQGLRADFSVINFSRQEQLEEAMKVSVTIKPTFSANAPQWLET